MNEKEIYVPKLDLVQKLMPEFIVVEDGTKYYFHYGQLVRVVFGLGEVTDNE